MKNKQNKWISVLAMAAMLITAPLAFGGTESSQEMQALQTEIQELQAWKTSIQKQPVKEETDDNRFYFRGGYAQMNRHRGRADELLTDLNGLVGESNGDQGFYFGASFDFSLNDNLWGLTDDVELMAELMFEYKDFSNLSAGPRTDPALDGQIPLGVIFEGTLGPAFVTDTDSVEVTEFVLAASPKIKFMKGYDFRPWIIPAGFALHLISPPSNGFTILAPGVMFGIGFDYTVWKNISLGMDGRYHIVSRTGVDGVDLDGFAAGFNVGFGF